MAERRIINNRRKKNVPTYKISLQLCTKLILTAMKLNLKDTKPETGACCGNTTADLQETWTLTKVALL